MGQLLRLEHTRGRRFFCDSPRICRGGRIRTYDNRYQKPVACHLPTPLERGCASNQWHKEGGALRRARFPQLGPSVRTGQRRIRLASAR
jgi:hypothetical protein